MVYNASNQLQYDIGFCVGRYITSAHLERASFRQHCAAHWWCLQHEDRVTMESYSRIHVNMGVVSFRYPTSSAQSAAWMQVGPKFGVCPTCFPHPFASAATRFGANA